MRRVLLIGMFAAFAPVLSGGAATHLRVNQRVLLKAPTGFSQWLFSENCTIAWLLASHQSYRDLYSGRIKQGDEAFVIYRENTEGVITDVDSDGYCAYVELRDGSAGWVANSLIQLSAGEIKRLELQKKAADDSRRAREQYLSSLPRLISPSGNVIVAVDSGCNGDLKRLRSSNGVALRRGLSELIRLGCVFTVPSGTRAEANRLDGESYSIVIQEGPGRRKTGVVDAAYLQK